MLVTNGTFVPRLLKGIHSCASCSTVYFLKTCFGKGWQYMFMNIFIELFAMTPCITSGLNSADIASKVWS